MLAALPAAAAATPLPDGVEADLVYTAEVWHNADGGRRRGTAYLDNLDATLALDADRLWGWTDTRIFVYALYNNGDTLSEDLAGDLQVISNLETGVSAARLYEAWIDTPIGGHGSLRAGLYDLNSEFDVLESAGLFINSAHGIGSDFGLSGRNGPSIFPVTSLALRLAWNWPGPWQGRLALLDGVPGDPDDADATAIDLGSDDGALVAAELERRGRSGRLLLGAWRYTAAFDEWPRSVPGVQPRSRGNGGVYLRGETALGDGALLAFARVGLASAAHNAFSEFFSAGLTWSGVFREHDRLGVAMAWGEASSRLVRARDGADAREVALELTYRIPLGQRLTLQPDLQYVINPGLEPGLDPAWAVGVRLVADLY